MNGVPDPNLNQTSTTLQETPSHAGVEQVPEGPRTEKKTARSSSRPNKKPKHNQS